MRVRTWRHLAIFSVFFFGYLILVAMLLARSQDVLEKEETVMKESLANVEISVNWQLPDHGNLSAVDGRWQTVTGTATKLFVYSAFWEEPSSLRMIGVGVTRLRQVERVWCRVWYDEVRSATVRARIKVIREHQNMAHSAYFIMCPLDGTGSTEVPHSVSIVKDLMDTPANRVLVVRSGDAPQTRQELAVCVKPIYNYNKTLELVEFIEMYRLLGAERFTLYLHTAAPSIKCILQYYQDIGVVEVFDWQVALVSQKDVRTENMFAALNDCLHRHRGRSDNLAMVDFDEFIIPRANMSLLEVIRRLDMDKDSLTAGSYVFQNAFFYRQFAHDLSTVPDGDPIASRLLTVTLTQRKTALLPHRQRSKYVCKPKRTTEAGNHFVWEHVPSYRGVAVGEGVALSQHYRVCEFGGDDCVNAANMADRTAQRYQHELVPRVREIWDNLEQDCQLPDIYSEEKDYRL